MSVEVKVQRDTKVILAFNNEREAGELLQLLSAVDWNRCPWAHELSDSLDDAGINVPQGTSLESLIDSSFVVMA